MLLVTYIHNSQSEPDTFFELESACTLSHGTKFSDSISGEKCQEAYTGSQQSQDYRKTPPPKTAYKLLLTGGTALD